MRRFDKILIYSLFLFSAINSFSQKEIKGRVIDSVSGEGLAFVNIIYNSQKNGVATNINGGFVIPLNEKVEFLSLSYLGYNPVFLSKQDFSNKDFIVIKMPSIVEKINTVEVFPGVNPAHRIINLAVENRDKNNPEKMGSFSYQSYTKLIFTFQIDSLFHIIEEMEQPGFDTTKIDSGYYEMRDFLEKQHMFISETVTEREFIHPDKNNEKVLATRSAGFKQPFFAFNATQFQSFSFYSDMFFLSDRVYLNPISKGSTSKYFFLLEDTIFTPQNDTVFVISFRPRKGKFFDSLKGFLHINSRGYAIQNVKAEPNEPVKGLNMKIQQRYELINDKQWFPVQLNTDFTFNTLNVEIPKGELSLLGIGKTYFTNIQLNPELNKRDFSIIEYKMEEDAYYRDSTYWAKYRLDSLTIQDINTYRVIDSIGEKYNFDKNFKIIEALMLGKVPVKFINIDLYKTFGFNRFEGLKLGLGLETNRKVSSVFSLYGHGMYGFKDKKWKYGGGLVVNLIKKKELQLKFDYNNSIRETAGWSYFEDKDMLNTESYRGLYIEQMEYLEAYEASVNFRSLRYLRTNVFYRQTNVSTFGDYEYINPQSDVSNETGNFFFEEVGLQVKYAYKEKFMQMPSGNYSLGSNYPIFRLSYSYGLNWGYSRIVAKIYKRIILKDKGKLMMQIEGGLLDKPAPRSLAFVGKGSYSGDFPVDVDNSFATMRMNEFLSDRFAYLFLKYDFGKLFKIGKFAPSFSIAQNSGIAETRFAEYHQNYSFSTMEKGYYESGLIISNLIKFNNVGYGVGVYYRYGPYEFMAPKNNFAYRLTFGYIF
ncbi:MAG: carboxypeptidase-like regulatory domain-containing protein [Bacteroidales bacterium]|nr:carboxypeptidase-like regulatory domain-containing protein [Bacteroidales bacterium]